MVGLLRQPAPVLPRAVQRDAGLPFPGDPDRYPHRDEVVAYLEGYADRSTTWRSGPETRVTDVAADGPGFTVYYRRRRQLVASGVVVASGSFGNPHRPLLPGAESFRGSSLTSLTTADPTPYVGQRVVVLGAGNSAIQVAHELAEKSTVTLARRRSPSSCRRSSDGHDVHHWFDVTGFDHMPGSWLALLGGAPLVLDTGDYRAAYESGRLDQRPCSPQSTEDEVEWADGGREHVDAIILATGYRPNVNYLSSLGALDEHGRPRHIGGISTTHPGLVYLGLEGQRSFASNTLRGVSH